MRTRTGYWVLGLVFLGLLSIYAQREGLTYPLENAILRVLAPFQPPFSRAGLWLNSQAETLQNLQTLPEERRKQQELIQNLTRELVRLREVELENARLKEQLKYRGQAPGGEYLAATVLAREPRGGVQTLLLDRGAQEGVKVGMIVVASGGLVGRVTQVYDTVAKVLPITDPSSTVNAMVQRPDSRATGLVVGQPGERLVLKFLPVTEEVKAEDVIITSGLGGGFPKGILIGKVTEVRQRDVEAFKEAELTAAVPLRRLEEVLILLSFQPKRLDER